MKSIIRLLPVALFAALALTQLAQGAPETLQADDSPARLARPTPPGIPPQPLPPRFPGFESAPSPPKQGTVFVGKPAPGTLKRERTFSSLDAPDPAHDTETFPAGSINLEQADLPQVFKIYEDVSGRTMIASPALAPAKISLRTKTTLLRREVLQAFDTILAQHGITIIPLGTEFVKAVPVAQAGTEAPPLVDLPRDQLPESDSYMTYWVRVKAALPHEVAPALQPLAKMPGASIMALDNAGLIVLRDYSNNIRRMLQLLDEVDVPGPRPKPIIK